VLGIPITTQRGNSGGILIDNNYKLSRGFLNDEDYRSIAIADSILNNLSYNKGIKNILGKLSLIDPKKIKSFQEELSDYFIVDLFDEKIKKNDDIQEAINYSLEEEYLVELITYYDTYIIAPISYVLKKDGMYIYGYKDEEYVLIKIDNIKSVKNLNNEFERDFIAYKENNNIINIK
ncbi:MAG: helix-turn-helix transcriptional regulator, partial [Clostridium sp.]